jgi:hypothetical protein
MVWRLGALENMALILALEVEENFATGLGSWPGWDTSRSHNE